MSSELPLAAMVMTRNTGWNAIMNGPVTTVRRSRTGAALAVLAVALALAACQTDGTGPSAAGAPKAEAAPAAAVAKPEQAQAAKPAEPADDPEPMTRARAARECWMRTEKGNPHQDLDKRADVVNKCIEDRLKAAGAAAPKS
jgi:hypothetical protein